MATESDRIIRIDYTSRYLADNGYLSDFIIGINDGTKSNIYAHRIILATVSKYFKDKFDSNPTLEYFLLPKQFRSEIIKLVIFCIYNQYVNFRKKDLTAFLEAVKFLEINGFEQIQQSNFQFEKKFSVAIRKLTHEELEKAMGGKCNDNSHQIDNDSRKITKTTENKKGKCINKSEKSIDVEKNPSNEKEISEDKSTTKDKIKNDDDVKLTRKSKRWYLVKKGTKDAFGGFCIEAKKNDDEHKPTQKSRGAPIADGKTKKSIQKNSKKDEIKTKLLLNQSIDSDFRESNVFNYSSAEENSKTSTSKSKKIEVPKEDHFKQPHKSQGAKTGGGKTKKSMAKHREKEMRKNKTTLNQLIDSDFGDMEKVKQVKIDIGNAFKHSSAEESQKPSTSKIQKGDVSKKDAPPNLNEKFTSKQPIRACTNRNINEHVATEEIDDIEPPAEELAYVKLLSKNNSDKNKAKARKVVEAKLSVNDYVKQTNNKPIEIKAVTTGKVIVITSDDLSSEQSSRPLKRTCKKDNVPKIDDPKPSQKSRVIKDNNKDSGTSVQNPFESNASSKPRSAERQSVSVQVVCSTLRSVPKRKATTNVTHNNVTETPMRKKVPKRRRLIFLNRSRYRSGNSSSDSLSSKETPRKRSKSRLLHLSKTSDSDSENSAAKGFESGAWIFGSESSINTIESIHCS